MEDTSVVSVRLIWTLGIAVLVSYVVHFVGHSIVVAETNDYLKQVTAFDQTRKGIHHLTGIVTVPSKCSQVSVSVENTAIYMHRIIFTTRDDSHVCANVPDARTFAIDVPASDEKEIFSAEMDGEPMTFTVVRK